MTKPVKENKVEPLEKQVWKAADKLRKNINAAEYKHVEMGLTYLKCISDCFLECIKRGAPESGGIILARGALVGDVGWIMSMHC